MAKPGISHTALARLARVARPVVSAAVSAGLLDLLPNGRIDPDGAATRAYIASHTPGRAMSGLDAKVAAFAAKVALLRQRLDEQEATLVERDAYLRASLERVPAVHSWLAGIPERRADELAAALGCPAEIARGVLTELVLRIAGELGDIGSDVMVAIVAA